MSFKMPSLVILKKHLESSSVQNMQSSMFRATGEAAASQKPKHRLSSGCRFWHPAANYQHPAISCDGEAFSNGSTNTSLGWCGHSKMTPS